MSDWAQNWYRRPSMHYLEAYFLFFRNMHFSPILGTSNVKITEYRQISLVKSFSKIQRYSGILVFCGETTFVGTSVHVCRIELKVGTDDLPCIISGRIFSKYAFLSDIGDLESQKYARKTNITVLLKDFTNKRKIRWFWHLRCPISERNAHFEKIKNTPRDNAWKVACTNFELNPTHRSGPTKKQTIRPTQRTIFGFQGLYPQLYGNCR